MLRLALGACALCLLTLPASAGSVNGYFRNDGTYVAPYYRSSPDSSYNNNYSVSPNVNPYTLKSGTLSPTLNDRPPSNDLFGSGR
jgi:hypothetical protein